MTWRTQTLAEVQESIDVGRASCSRFRLLLQDLDQKERPQRGGAWHHQQSERQRGSLRNRIQELDSFGCEEDAEQQTYGE